MADVTLTIQSPAGTQRLQVAKDRLTIGRGDGVDVSIEDKGVSRLQASLYREGEHVWIVDERSAGGTLVNAAPVSSMGTPLVDGDKISMGDSTTIWVSLAGQGKAAASRANGTSATQWPILAGVLLVVAVLIGALGVNWLKGRADKAGSGRRIETGNSRTASDATGNAGDRSSNVDPAVGDAAGRSNSADDGRQPPRTTRLYQQMTEAERLEFTYQRARHISRMMGNREYQFPDNVLPYIRLYLDGYTRRVGNRSTRMWGEDLDSLFARARRHAPYIIRSFNTQGVPAVVGLYIPMIESEYRECLVSPAGAKGLFQFIAPTASAYGVDPDERCNVEKMAPAAARYMKDRIAEFGTDSMSVALAIAGYNRSPDSVRRDLHDVLNSENKERSFWTLVANSTKLDRPFQNENVKYVPKFFAAAIVGETPWAFGLEMNALSSYTQSANGS